MARTRRGGGVSLPIIPKGFRVVLFFPGGLLMVTIITGRAPRCTRSWHRARPTARAPSIPLSTQNPMKCMSSMELSSFYTLKAPAVQDRPPPLRHGRLRLWGEHGWCGGLATKDERVPRLVLPDASDGGGRGTAPRLQRQQQKAVGGEPTAGMEKAFGRSATAAGVQEGARGGGRAKKLKHSAP